MTEAFFADRGLWYRTNDWQATRETIIFLHGVSGSSSAWKPFEAAVSSQFNTLSFDIRGHGRSMKYPGEDDYTIPLFADDLHALVLFLKIERFILVTHSFGVLIGLEYLSHHADRVGKAVFLSPSANVHVMLSARIIRPLFMLTRLLALFPERTTPGEHVDYDLHRKAKDWDIPMTLADVRNTSLRVYLFASKQALSVSYTDLLPSLSMPILLIHGKEDSIFPYTNTLTMAEMLPNAQAVILDHADHILVVSHADRVIPLLQHFLAHPEGGAPAHVSEMETLVS